MNKKIYINMNNLTKDLLFEIFNFYQLVIMQVYVQQVN